MAFDKVLTDFYFEPGQGFEVRPKLTFSDHTKIRLDPEDYNFKLKLELFNTTY